MTAIQTRRAPGVVEVDPARDEAEQAGDGDAHQLLVEVEIGILLRKRHRWR